MQEAIERTKREIANIKHESDDGNRFIEASNELDAIVTKTEAATQEILAAAEAIQEHAWTMREAGADEASCDDIDARATEIFMACSFQDLTGQRTQKIVNVLQYLESRINMMISIWGIQGASADDGAYIEDNRPMPIFSMVRNSTDAASASAPWTRCSAIPARRQTTRRPLPRRTSTRFSRPLQPGRHLPRGMLRRRLPGCRPRPRRKPRTRWATMTDKEAGRGRRPRRGRDRHRRALRRRRRDDRCDGRERMG